jgi:hypothetical protein
MAGGAGGFIGGFNPLDQDPIEYSGKWGLKEQVQAIAAGRWTGIPTFELYAWGQNAPEGRLGDNTRINRSSPVQVSNTVKWEQPAAGYGFAAALATDGTLWTWGQAGNGQLGGNNNFPTRSSPVQVGTLTNWGSLAAGHEHCHAIKTDGTLWSWGKATDYGQLGDNTKISKSSPIQIGARTDWSQVSAFFHTSAATTTSGQLFTWGRNNYGQLADNTTFSRSSPVQVGALTNWAQASAGLAACAPSKPTAPFGIGGPTRSETAVLLVFPARYKLARLQTGRRCRWDDFMPSRLRQQVSSMVGALSATVRFRGALAIAPYKLAR